MHGTHIDLREIQSIGADTQELVASAGAVRGLRAAGIAYAGLSRARPGFRFLRRAPPFHALLACAGGAGRVLVDGAWRRCERGQTYLMPAGALHAYHGSEDAEPWVIAWLIWARRGRPAMPPEPALVACDPDLLHPVVAGLHAELHGAADPQALDWWAALVRLHADRLIGRETGDRLGSLWLRVATDPARAWDLAQLSALAGLSGERLRQLTVARHGRSPMRHVAHLRMARAAHLLRTTDWPVHAVADAVGYEAFAFSHAFRRWAGLRPLEYRRRDEA